MQAGQTLVTELGFSEPGDIAAISEEDIDNLARLGLKKLDVLRLRRLVAAACSGQDSGKAVAPGAAPAAAGAAVVGAADDEPAGGTGSTRLVRGDSRATRSAGEEGGGLKGKLSDKRKLVVSV